MRNNNIDGLRTALISILSGRKGLTLIVDFSYQYLVENGCIGMLKEMSNLDCDCNLIMTCQDLKEIKSFKFNFMI